jgi:hypothetical protein
MDTLLILGPAVFLIGMWFFGYIMGSGFSKTFEQRSVEPVKEPRPRSKRVTYPAGRAIALQRAA